MELRATGLHAKTKRMSAPQRLAGAAENTQVGWLISQHGRRLPDRAQFNRVVAASSHRLNHRNAQRNLRKWINSLLTFHDGNTQFKEFVRFRNESIKTRAE